MGDGGRGQGPRKNPSPNALFKQYLMRFGKQYFPKSSFKRWKGREIYIPDIECCKPFIDYRQDFIAKVYQLLFISILYAVEKPPVSLGSRYGKPVYAGGD